MALNGSELINEPIRTIFSPFTNLFGSGFWLIPLSFIALALYMKTRNLTVVGMYMIAVGVLWGAGNIFVEYNEMAYVYLLFTVLGFVSLIIGLFGFRR